MIGRILCRGGIHKLTGITIRWRDGGPYLEWFGCRRCHKIQRPDILARRSEGYEVDWTDRSGGPAWGYTVKEESDG